MEYRRKSIEVPDTYPSIQISMASLPVASTPLALQASAEQQQEQQEQQQEEGGAPQLTTEEVLAALKGLESPELFKVMKQALAEAEKRSKAAGAPRRATAAKKAGSMPKGVVPPQLRKPRAWVDFTLKHALAHGWEAFTVYQSKKDKVTGEKIEEEIEMPASELLNGANIYKGSVDEKHPAGKQLIHKDAMSLSKQRWAPKEKTGTHHALYQEFESSYVDDSASTTSSDSDSEKKVIVRKTVAEKAAEAEAKKAAKAAEAEAKKAAKEQEKEAKKAEKEAEKQAKAAEKEAEKQAKAATKKAAVPVKTVAPVKAVTAKAVTAEAVPVKAAAMPVKAAAMPVKATVPVKATAAKAAAAKKPAAESWSPPADGMVHPWSYKGKQYLRNSDNEVWLKGEDGACGEWQGMFKPAEDRIDDSVAEPVFDDE